MTIDGHDVSLASALPNQHGSRAEPKVHSAQLLADELPRFFRSSELCIAYQKALPASGEWADCSEDEDWQATGPTPSKASPPTSIAGSASWPSSPRDDSWTPTFNAIDGKQLTWADAVDDPYQGGGFQKFVSQDVELNSGGVSQMDHENWRPHGSLPSLGSADHESGNCRPCAHAWRLKGCDRGTLCERCHLCGQGDFLDYRKSLRAAKQSNKRETKMRQRRW
eukprot:TRINITY_DN27396_c0_g1_i1.p1 TRINITY_DN27396_c0_g1~~TRINITY_DN27396_c0_g1_i1.p1  ORF type:complete len:223 (-),score=31.60 TRINITY_DN27396_c0_g1_i1:202-870(-)